MFQRVKSRWPNSFCCPEQFYIKVNEKPAMYNTRIKLPEDQPVDFSSEGELGQMHTHSNACTPSKLVFFTNRHCSAFFQRATRKRLKSSHGRHWSASRRWWSNPNPRRRKGGNAISNPTVSGLWRQVKRDRPNSPSECTIFTSTVIIRFGCSFATINSNANCSLKVQICQYFWTLWKVLRCVLDRCMETALFSQVSALHQRLFLCCFSKE